jgi:ATP-dependent Clp protease ATP-binding subunit ClpC
MASKAPLLSEVARSALSLAVAEAVRHGQAVAGTDHLLLGICQMAEGGAAAILEALGVPRDRVQAVLEPALGYGVGGTFSPETLTPRAQQVMDHAASITVRLGSTSIGTEHLLLGLLLSEEGLAVDALRGLGVTLDKVLIEGLGAVGGRVTA